MKKRVDLYVGFEWGAWETRSFIVDARIDIEAVAKAEVLLEDDWPDHAVFSGLLYVGDAEEED